MISGINSLLDAMAPAAAVAPKGDGQFADALGEVLHQVQAVLDEVADETLEPETPPEGETGANAETPLDADVDANGITADLETPPPRSAVESAMVRPPFAGSPLDTDIETDRRPFELRAVRAVDAAASLEQGVPTAIAVETAAPIERLTTATHTPPTRSTHAPSPAEAAFELDTPDVELRRATLAPRRAHVVIGEGPGRTAITVTISNQQVYVRANTATPGAAAALENASGDLDAALQQHGMSLGDMSARQSKRDPKRRQRRDDAPVRTQPEKLRSPVTRRAALAVA